MFVELWRVKQCIGLMAREELEARSIFKKVAPRDTVVEAISPERLDQAFRKIESGHGVDIHALVEMQRPPTVWKTVKGFEVEGDAPWDHPGSVSKVLSVSRTAQVSLITRALARQESSEVTIGRIVFGGEAGKEEGPALLAQGKRAEEVSCRLRGLLEEALEMEEEVIPLQGMLVVSFPHTWAGRVAGGSVLPLLRSMGGDIHPQYSNTARSGGLGLFLAKEWEEFGQPTIQRWVEEVSKKLETERREFTKAWSKFM
jgi:hypothetical protein